MFLLLLLLLELLFVVVVIPLLKASLRRLQTLPWMAVIQAKIYKHSESTRFVHIVRCNVSVIKQLVPTSDAFSIAVQCVFDCSIEFWIFGKSSLRFYVRWFRWCRLPIIFGFIQNRFKWSNFRFLDIVSKMWMKFTAGKNLVVFKMTKKNWWFLNTFEFSWKLVIRNFATK